MKTSFLTAVLLLTFGISGFAEETVEGYLPLSKCKNEDSATHTRKCALSCKASGFGIGTADGRFRPLILEGALLAVESSTWK